MVMAQSLFKVLKAQDAGRAIDVLAPGWTRALLERMPEVRDAIEMPLGHGQLQLMTRRLLGISLRAAGYEQAILLPNSFKSALIPYWARIPRRTGYAGELRQWFLTDCRKLDRQRLTQTVQRFVALGLPDGAVLREPVPEPFLETSNENGRAALQRLGLETGQQPVLALCPGAEFGPAKNGCLARRMMYLCVTGLIRLPAVLVTFLPAIPAWKMPLTCWQWQTSSSPMTLA
jgi:heptosyltransferase-2